MLNAGPSVTYLRSPSFGHDVPWHGEPGLEDLLGIIHWGLEQLLQIFILRHVLVTLGLPLGYCLGK